MPANFKAQCMNKHHAWITAVAIGILVGAPCVAQDSEELEVIRLFGDFCTSDVETMDGKPFLDVRFAPVRNLVRDEIPRYGTWGGVFETDDERYANNEYVLGSGDDEVDLVSNLRRPKLAKDLPSFIWHVISVPSSSDDRVGFIARHKELAEQERNTWQQNQYRLLRRSEAASQDGTILFFVDEELPEDVISNITHIWHQTFRDAMQELVVRQFQAESRTYTHTFIYQDTPSAVEDINTEVGDRRNSSRRVLQPGLVFGFVLDNTGSCLASTTLEVTE